MAKKNSIFDDITKVGVGGLKSPLTGQPYSEEEMLEINDALNFGSMVSGNSHQMSAIDAYSQGREYEAETDFGKSRYDSGIIPTLGDYKNFRENRALSQPWYSKLVSGIGKGLVLAGTTFLDGTVGLICGIDSAIQKGEWSGLWNNDFSNTMHSINQKFEEWLPNYRTIAEQNNAWYQNLGTMNFWADSFIKNLGFTVGALYSGGAWAAPLKALKLPAIVGEVAGATLSAVNEGRIEANNNVSDWKKLQEAQIEDAYQKALSELLPDSPMYEVNRALLAQSRDRQLEELDQRANSMGNGILLANTILLSYTNFKTFGKIYSGGFKRAAREFVDTEKRELASRVLREEGKYVWKNYAAKEGVKTGLRTGLREGLEEMNQAWISETAGNWNAPDSPDAYYYALLDPDANIQTSDFLTAATKGFVDTYGSSKRWEEFVVGALTGLMGVPTVGKSHNASANTYIGRNKWIGLTGGLGGEISMNRERNRQGAGAVEIMNRYADRIQSQKDYFVQSQSFINAMDRWSSENDAFEYKNAEDNDDFAAISAYARVGKLQDLRDLVNKDFENMSDEDLDRIAKYTSKESDDPTVASRGGWRDIDGRYLSETEEGRKQMREDLAKKRDKILKNIDGYVNSVETVRAAVHESPQVTDDQINELAWLNWKLGRFRDRYAELKGENEALLNTYLRGLNEYKNALEAEIAEQDAYIKEDLTYANDEAFQKSRQVFKSLNQMISFIEGLQKTSEPLGIAALLRDKDFDEFVKGVFSEENFDLFNTLGDGQMQYSDAKKLYDDLQDITKMAVAAEQFNKRYREFIEDPLKLQLNREKLEHLSNSKRKNKQALNLAEKINAAEKLEDVVDKAHIKEALDTLEGAEERTPEIETAIEKTINTLELDTFKDEIFDIVNSLDGVDAQVQSDVQTLLASIEKREDLLENSEIYLDLNRIFREEEHVGKSDAHRNSDLEDRMAKAQMAILEAEKQLNEKEIILNSMGNGSLSNVANEVETTGSDATTKVEPVATAGEVISKTTESLNSEAEVFLSYLDIIDNTKKLELKNLIIEKVLKHLTAKTLIDVSSMANVDDINALVTNFESAFILYLSDKVSPENDRNPINPEKESSELKEEQPQNSEKPETQGLVRMYWRPSISRLPIYDFDKTNPLQYFHENDALLLKHYTQPLITYIKAVGEYLKNTGAFDRADNGLIKDNEKIYFATDPELNKKAGAFVILLVDENNNVLGNLPTGKSDNLFEEELDTLAGSYIGLDIFTEAFKDVYNKDDSKTDGLWVMPKVFSVIDNWMIGKTIYSKEYNTIETIFSSTDSTGNKTELSYQFAVGAVDRNGNVRIVRDSDRRQDTVEDREINKPTLVINGLPYVLLSTGNNGSSKKYTAVPVAMKKLNGDSSLSINGYILLALGRIFSLEQSSTPHLIVRAKESLQELVGAKFTIIVKQNSVELKVLNTENKWETVYVKTPELAFDLAAAMAFNNMVDKYRYQMALKYINKKFVSENYNDIIKDVVETNLYPGLNHTLSNWFTIRPLKQEGDTFKMLERKQVVPPKTTGVNPTRKQNAATDTLVSFEYKGRQMKIDTSDWNSLYFEDKGAQKKLVIRDSKGNLNTNSAKAAAYAFGVIQHQDMTKPYDTQWGYYNPTTLEFEEKPIDDVIDLDDGILSNVFGAAEQEAKNSVNTEFTTEELQEMAENKGMLKTPLHKRAWGALTLGLKSTIIQNPIMFDSLAVKYNVKSKTFSVDIDLFIKDSALFRKTKDTVVEKWNSEEEINWLGKVLPQFNTSERLQIVNALIKVSNSSNPEYAWGQFKNGIITIYKGAAKGTLYHEAFHAVTHTLLNDNEVKLLFEEAVKKYGDLTKLDLEENLAEDFRQYVQYEQDPNVSYIRKIFRKLKHFVQGLFGKDRHINRLFYKINRGNYANRKPSSTDAVLNTNVQYEKELKEILDKAPRDEQGRLLAPNGKPSNLTERQYAQVRTKAFIDWFGDWINEKIYTDRLYKKSLPSITLNLQKQLEQDFNDGKEIIVYAATNALSKVLAEGIKFTNSGTFIEGKNENTFYASLNPEYAQGYAEMYYQDGINIDDIGIIKLTVKNNSGKSVIEGLEIRINDLTDIVTFEEVALSKEPHKHLVYNKNSNNVSKVVDENGEPMVVYHHTDNPNLSEFNNNFSNYFSLIKGGTKHAIFFTTNPEKILNRKYTIPVFLNLKTPFKYNGTKESMHQAGTDYTTLVNNAESVLGAIFTNLDDNKLLNLTVLVAYNPNQIKSATDNIGTFSRESNNIYYRKLESLFELQNLKDELQYIKLQLSSTETIPEVKELYRKWGEVLKIKERLFYYNGDVQGWIDDNGYQDVAEPFMKNYKEGYVKAFTREVIKEKATQLKAQNTQYLKEQLQAIQNRIDYLERNKDTFISDEALSFQEEQEYVEIMLHYLLKTQFKNLTQEEQEFITSREISEKEFNDLTLEEREHLLFCR